MYKMLLKKLRASGLNLVRREFIGMLWFAITEIPCDLDLVQRWLCQILRSSLMIMRTY